MMELKGPQKGPGLCPPAARLLTGVVWTSHTSTGPVSWQICQRQHGPDAAIDAACTKTTVQVCGLAVEL